MAVLIVEPWYGGSHKLWIDGLSASLKEDVELLTLSDRHWKWRMEGGALELARTARDLETMSFSKVIVSSMLNFPLFASLVSGLITWDESVIMMHENQFAYPSSPNDKDHSTGRDLHYPFLNFTSCLLADRVVFNSHYNRETFLEGAAALLKKMPDHQCLQDLEGIRDKSSVIPLGFNLDNYLSAQEERPEKVRILWNHRWEEDKNPQDFFRAVDFCKDLPIELIVVGECRHNVPESFIRAKETLAGIIGKWGFCDSREEYLSLLSTCHIQPVTSCQDFFGISLIEAMASGVTPLVPDRLALVEHFPDNQSLIYSSQGQLEQMLRQAVTGILEKGYTSPVFSQLENYHWKKVVESWE